MIAHLGMGSPKISISEVVLHEDLSVTRPLDRDSDSGRGEVRKWKLRYAGYDQPE